jgi:N-methylhydantoinase A
MRVGVDIGGTFTDLVISEDGALRVHKLPSTPADPAQAMLAGLTAIAGALDRLTHVVHGSTVATNAILERKGAKVALITTKGFRDILALGRQNRPDLYALHPTLPPPLIPRDLCFEVPERIDHHGEIVEPLDIDALNDVLAQIKKLKVDAVAVCFLYSFLNSDHELIVRGRMSQISLLDDTRVALSCEVLPEFREYERASTVALEAYVRPIMSRYIAKLRKALPDHTALRIMKSDGGVISAETVNTQAIQTALSGPAAGVIGAMHLARLAGYEQIITLDIGGTSTDVALCPGEPIQRAQSEIDKLPLRVRLLDIETVGAGGGSLARLDAGGALRVGPQSAGADPGPLCYGRGGEHVTVTDANLIAGRLDAAHFLGGGMPLDIEAARRGLAALGATLGVSAEQAARGVIEVADANIERAIRRVSVGRGYDPRDFTLVAFGGAGPLHACQIAARLEIPRVLVPRYPGVLCAFGLLVADVLLEYSRPVMQPASPGTIGRLRAQLGELVKHARRDLKREGVDPDAVRLVSSLDMRYQGQAYELSVPFITGDSDLKPPVKKRFNAAHEQAYGHALPDRPIEIVNMRLQAVGLVEKPLLTPESVNGTSGAPIATRTDGAALYDRESLLPGAAFKGAALLYQYDSTVYVPEGWSARVDGYRNLVLEQA